MVMQAHCVCGKVVRFNPEEAGKTINCIRCRRPIDLPGARAAAPEPTPAPEPATVPAEPGSGLRDAVYWVLALAFVPLAIMLGQPEPPSLRDRLEREAYRLPQGTQQRVLEMLHSREASLEEILDWFPNKRLEGACLPRSTWLHWLFAAATAAIFWCVVAACFAPDSAKPRDLLCVGLFTGSIGVVLLLAAHVMPFFGGLIEFCHSVAQDRRSEFFVVFAGFTFGVGLVEETCKALPLLWYFRRHRTIGWRLACLWGLASGAGFGIAEGIMYSATFYNGIEPSTTYLVRFASCVALHAIWTASAGITLFRNQDLFHEAHRDAATMIMYRDQRTHEEEADQARQSAILYAFAVLRMIAAVMFLHGLYDAALTRQKYLLALLTAIVSFAWLAWQIESCRRAEAPAPAETEAADA